MTMTNAPSGTIRSALRYPSFRFLLSALAVSQVSPMDLSASHHSSSTAAKRRRPAAEADVELSSGIVSAATASLI